MSTQTSWYYYKYYEGNKDLLKYKVRDPFYTDTQFPLRENKPSQNKNYSGMQKSLMFEEGTYCNLYYYLNRTNLASQDPLN